MKYELIYFKESGKYYSGGEFELDGYLWDAVVHTKLLMRTRRLPGLVKDHSEFDVLVTDPEGLPHLIKCSRR